MFASTNARSTGKADGVSGAVPISGHDSSAQRA